MNDKDQSENILDRICIAMPCSIGWENMKGTDEVRLCSGCDKNVYNISVVSKKRAEQILQNTEQPCVRLYRNADGSIVSDECPNWLKPIRRTWKKCVGIAVSILAVLISPQNAKAEPGATARDQNMFQTEPTVIDGHPYGGRGRPERKKTPSAVPTFQITDGVPIDPRHHKVRIGSKDWRDYYVKASWPASINRIGITKVICLSWTLQALREFLDLTIPKLLFNQSMKTNCPQPLILLPGKAWKAPDDFKQRLV